MLKSSSSNVSFSGHEISSDHQGALTPRAVAVINKNLSIEDVTAAGGATPRQLDENNLPQNQWANLSVEEETNNRVVNTPTRATSKVGTLDSAALATTPSTTTAARKKNALNTQAGILPDRYTADLVHWQSPSDLPERRLMVQRIITMTKHKRLDTTSVVEMDRTPSLAKRIELSLYSRAASFNEYKDLNTLRRRLQSLVSLSFHEAALSRKIASTSATTTAAAAAAANSTSMSTTESKTTTTTTTTTRVIGNKRKIMMEPCGQLKRSRTKKKKPSDSEKNPKIEIERKKPEIETKHQNNPNVAVADDGCQSGFLQLSEDLLHHHVFSFLTGKEMIQSCQLLNHFTHLILPNHVTNLQMELNEIKQVLEIKGFSSNFLFSFINLQEFCIYNKKTPSDFMMTKKRSSHHEEFLGQQEQSFSLHAWGCNELDLSHDNIGEEIIEKIAKQIEKGACPRLKSLILVSIFTNTCRRNGLHSLCKALVKCSQLEDLLLGGNGISDVGTVDIAALLKNDCLPNLYRLDLRRNYIGESGLKRIMSALSNGKCQKLKFLCMGGNIITDNCVKPVVDLLSRSLCPQMRFLGLEDNFLSARGVHAIIQAAVIGGMMPKLHHVSNDTEETNTMATTSAYRA